MASLADELSAAMCPSEESPNGPTQSGLTQSSYSTNKENSKNLANKLSPKYSPLDDIGTKQVADEYSYAFKTTEDMEMTCDITMPAIRLMKSEGQIGGVGHIMPPKDIATDDNGTSSSLPTTLRIEEEEDSKLSNSNTFS